MGKVYNFDLKVRFDLARSNLLDLWFLEIAERS